MSKLTDKQELFCHEYLIDLNKSQAAIRAGYSEKTAGETGYENLKKPQIQERITELQAERAKQLNIDKDFVVTNLLEAMRICKGIDKTHVVTTTKDGIITEEVFKTDMTNFVKIQDMFFKHVGGYEKDNEQKKTELNIDLGAESTEDLIKRAEAIKKLNE